MVIISIYKWGIVKALLSVHVAGISFACVHDIPRSLSPYDKAVACGLSVRRNDRPPPGWYLTLLHIFLDFPQKRGSKGR